MLHDVAVSISTVYVPAPQFTQAMPLLLRPGPHSFTQEPPLGPLQPLLQLQAVIAVEPVKPPVAELSEQFEHAAAPVASLKLSDKQAVGVPPSAPVYPALATQAVIAVQPVKPPVAVLSEQSEQLAVPVTPLNVSTPQMVHGPPSGPE